MRDEASLAHDALGDVASYETEYDFGNRADTQRTTIKFLHRRPRLGGRGGGIQDIRYKEMYGNL